MDPYPTAWAIEDELRAMTNFRHLGQKMHTSVEALLCSSFVSLEAVKSCFFFFGVLQCFVRFKPRKTAMLKFCGFEGCEKLFEHYSVL